MNEEEWNSRYVQGDGEYSRLWVAIADELGIRITQDRMPVPDYVELSPPCTMTGTGLSTGAWNRELSQSDKNERYELLRERIRVLLRRDLPHRVPKEVCEQLAPKAAEIKKIYQEQMLREFGEVEEGAFPPCMQALITALAAGTNLTHAVPFFAHRVPPQHRHEHNRDRGTVARSPDFDLEKTMYQVEHITGRGDRERDRVYDAGMCRDADNGSLVSTGMHSANESVIR